MTVDKNIKKIYKYVKGTATLYQIIKNKILHILKFSKNVYMRK